MSLIPKWLQEKEIQKTKAGALGSTKNQSQKAVSNRREQEAAKQLGFEQQPNSGAGDFNKGDLRSDNFVLDHKRIKGGMLVINRKELVKIDRESVGLGKLPGILHELEEISDGVEKYWVTIPASVFKKMLENGQDKGIL